MKLTQKTENKGFTLIEILVVIGIIAVLAAIVLVAINPALRFAQAQNSQRNANITAILDAAGQYIVDNQGDSTDLGLGAEEPVEDTNLCTELIPEYLAVFPSDPDSPMEGDSVDDCGDLGDTGYTIEEVDGRITVCAPLALEEAALGDDAEVICVAR